MRFAVGLLILLLPMIPTVVAIRDVVARPFDDPQKRMIWLLFIIFVPVLGGTIYLLFKKRKANADKNS
jgi:hypothetical protein